MQDGPPRTISAELRAQHDRHFWAVLGNAALKRNGRSELGPAICCGWHKSRLWAGRVIMGRSLIASPLCPLTALRRRMGRLRHRLLGTPCGRPTPPRSRINANRLAFDLALNRHMYWLRADKGQGQTPTPPCLRAQLGLTVVPGCALSTL